MAIQPVAIQAMVGVHNLWPCMNIRMGRVSGSSLLKQVGFAGGPGDNSTLRIKFHDATLDFFKVPYLIYRGLALAKDHSSYYLKNINGKFDYKKL